MLTCSELSLLNNNVKTCQTIDDPSRDEVLLVPSLLRGTALGRAWLWAFVETESLQDKLKIEIKATHEIFQKLVLEVRSLSEKIAQFYLDEARRDKTVSRRAIDIAEELRCFFQIQTPFCLKRSLASMNQVFQRHLAEKVFSQDDVYSLELFEKEYAMLAVEGILQADFPIEVFKRLLNKEQLSSKQKKQLEDWLQLVKEKNERLTPSLFHKALQGIGAFIAKEKELPQEEYINIYVLLEIALLNAGCEMLSLEDKVYSEWLFSLVTGAVVDSELPVQLGEAIQHKNLQSLGLFAFKREGFENQMVLLGKSIAFLGMWRMHCIEAMPREWRLKVEYRDPEGRFLVVEKLKSSLDDVNWKTKHGRVERDDFEKLKGLSKLVEVMAAQQKTPADTLYANIYFNCKDEVRCLVPIAKSGHFDFNALTKFVIKSASNGKNFPICRHLFTESGIKKDLVARFYLDIVEQHFLSKPVASIKEVASSHKYRIADPRVVDHIKEVHIPKLRELQHSIKLSLITRLKHNTEEGRKKLDEAISQAIVDFQKDAGFLASEWADSDTRITSFLLSNRQELFVAGRAGSLVA